MARKVTKFFDVYPDGLAQYFSDARGALVTTPVKQGAKALGITAASGTRAEESLTVTNALGDTALLSVYVQIPVLPSVTTAGTTVRILTWDGAGVMVAMDTTGHLRIENGAGTTFGGVSSGVVSVNTWTRLEWTVTIGTGAIDAATLNAYTGDSTTPLFTIGPLTSQTMSDAALGNLLLGISNSAHNASFTVYYDRLLINDSSGTSDNTMPPVFATETRTAPVFRAAGTAAISPTTIVSPTNLAPGLPTLVTGDVQVCVSACRSNTATPSTATTGWTAAPGFPVKSGTAGGGQWAVFLADSTAGAPTIAWTGVTTGTTGDASIAQILSYSGADMTDVAAAVLEAAPTVSDSGSQTTTIPVPAYTSVEQNTLLLGLISKIQDSAMTFTPPTSWTERVDQSTTNANGLGIEVAELLVATAGTTAATTATPTVTSSSRTYSAVVGLRGAVAPAITPITSSGDIFSESDASSLAAASTVTDTATGTEGTSVLARASTVTEAPTATDVSALAAASSVTETATGTEGAASTLAAASAVTDTATATDASSLAILVNQAVTDTATAADASALAQASTVTDTGTAADASGPLALASTVVEAPVATDASSVSSTTFASFSVTDTATGSDASSVTAPTASTGDTATVSDASTVTVITLIPVAAADDLTTVETEASVDDNNPDTIAVADVSSLALAAAVVDTVTATEPASAILAPTAVTDTAAAADVSQLVVAVVVTDTAGAADASGNGGSSQVGSETIAVSEQVTGLDRPVDDVFIAGDARTGLDFASGRADTAAVTDASQVNKTLGSASDTVSVTDIASITATAAATDSAVAADSSLAALVVTAADTAAATDASTALTAADAASDLVAILESAFLAVGADGALSPADGTILTDVASIAWTAATTDTTTGTDLSNLKVAAVPVETVGADDETFELAVVGATMDSVGADDQSMLEVVFYGTDDFEASDGFLKIDEQAVTPPAHYPPAPPPRIRRPRHGFPHRRGVSD